MTRGFFGDLPSSPLFVHLKQFDTLDVTVQEEFEKFLQERGINESLAVFIPEYAEYKEQKVRFAFSFTLGRASYEIGADHGLARSTSCGLQEYVSWLKNVKTFIEA